VEEGGAGNGREKARNEPPGDQTWIRNEEVILAFFISKSAAASERCNQDGV
jgi:hypothetical protein